MRDIAELVSAGLILDQNHRFQFVRGAFRHCRFDVVRLRESWRRDLILSAVSRLCVDDVSPQEGTRWPMRNVVNASAVTCYFALTDVTASPEILRGAELSRGQQSRQPGPLACRSREPGLLPRSSECRPGQGVAIASSRLLAQAGVHPRCVTRALIGAGY